MVVGQGVRVTFPHARPGEHQLPCDRSMRELGAARRAGDAPGCGQHAGGGRRGRHAVATSSPTSRRNRSHFYPERTETSTSSKAKGMSRGCLSSLGTSPWPRGSSDPGVGRLRSGPWSQPLRLDASGVKAPLTRLLAQLLGRHSRTLAHSSLRVDSLRRLPPADRAATRRGRLSARVRRHPCTRGRSRQ